MRIQVQVIPGSSQEKLESLGNGRYKLWVHAQPVRGKANERVQEVLARYFKVGKRQVQVHPTTSRKKWVDIVD